MSLLRVKVVHMFTILYKLIAYLYECAGAQMEIEF